MEEQGCKQFCEKIFKKFYGILGSGGTIKR
ncbi:hypothetical protein RB32ORF132w [Escherichia phage RB32]|uniref:Uncharacterized protein n=1 Tax=Escherichia phage RB32 TaxID=2681602 RepID=Q06EJ4_BPR32|nr:hypothetical protein RB32ORF132w [Escherichia phage RB32]ABI94956.1 hypothetical protein RB32ORF132w [Escherichia phage RB32]